MISTQEKFVIGDWVVDPVHNEISKNGQTKTIEQKAMEVLLYLAKNNSRAVSRQELLDAIWTNTYVTEESLTRCISILRKAFGDNPSNPSYIKTIRNKGYQLIAPVSEPVSQDQPFNLSNKIFGSTWFRIAAVALVLVLLGLLPTILVDNEKKGAPLWNEKPLTVQKGLETDPSISPDGSRFAYSAQNPETGNWNIYVRVLGAGSPYQLTNSEFDDRVPEWSPDGRFIAFVREHQQSSTLYILPAMGGSADKLVARNSNDFPYLSWSPDGLWIAYSDRPSPDASNAIFRVHVNTGKTEQLTQTTAQHWGDFAPSFSPDGQTISFIASVSAGTQAIYQLNLQDGSEKRITPSFANLKYQEWSRADGAIYYTSNVPVAEAIWKITEFEPLESRWTGLSGSDFSIGKNRIIVSREAGNLDLWNWTKNDAKLSENPWGLINSTAREYEPALSPDGSLLAFISDRTGYPELWIYNISDSSLKRLTHFDGTTDIRSPHWHPSGKKLAFNTFYPESHADIYTVDISGTPPKPLLAGPYNEINPNWDSNGRSLIFGSDETGKWEIWKYEAETNETEQLTTKGGYIARIVADQNTFYFTKYDQQGIWKYQKDKSDSLLIKTSVTDRRWDVSRSGIYFVHPTSGSANELLFYDFNRQSIQTMADLSELKLVRDISVLATDSVILSGSHNPESGIYLFTNQEK